MVSHDRVAHRWAQRPAAPKDHARGHSMFFEGDTIYSYGSHFPIARWAFPPKSSPVVLFTSRSYSVTTAKHKSKVHHALGYGSVFTVPNVRANSKTEHRDNVRALLQESAEALRKSKRARAHKARHLQESAELLDTARRYARLFRTGQRIPKTSAKIAEEIEAARALQRKREAGALVKARARDAEAFERWRAGDPDARCPHSYGTDRGYALMRVVERADGPIVQTSLGAEVPVDHVHRALPIVRAIKARGESRHRNGDTIRVGHFHLDAIDGATGAVTAGCHRFTWAEVERLAVQVEGGTQS